MKSLVSTVLVFLGCSLQPIAAPAEAQKDEPWELKEGVELNNGTARLIAHPARGGRIVWYSRDDGPNFFKGGCQIDIGPELDYPPRHPTLWTDPYRAETTGPLSVRLTSPPDEATGLQVIKEIELAASGAGVTLRIHMKNVESKEVGYCLWDRTMTSADYGFFELNPNSRFPARWSMRRGSSGTWRYDGTTPDSPRVKILDNLLITVPGNKMEKVAADSMAGWIAGFRNGWLYVKRFPVFPGGDYADGGNSVEIWVDAEGTRTEIEPLSPKIKLKPGASYSFIEQWELRRVEENISGPGDIPKLLPHVRDMAPLPDP